jgi:salicylate hydroxylase
VAALREYERLRRPRASRMQELSSANKTRFHLADGPGQQARDEAMAKGATDWSYDNIAWIYDHDAAL